MASHRWERQPGASGRASHGWEGRHGRSNGRRKSLVQNPQSVGRASSRAGTKAGFAHRSGSRVRSPHRPGVLKEPRWKGFGPAARRTGPRPDREGEPGGADNPAGLNLERLPAREEPRSTNRGLASRRVQSGRARRAEELRAPGRLLFPLPSRSLRLYLPSPMFDAVKAQLSATAGKLTHLRRFL